MKLRSLLLLFLIAGYRSISAQPDQGQKLIELGKAYHSFMFRNEPTGQMLRDLRQDVPKELKAATAFIAETISTKNKLLTDDHPCANCQYPPSCVRAPGYPVLPGGEWATIHAEQRRL